MSFFRFSQKIKFCYQANTAHGIHSPFVYRLVTKCLRNTSFNNQTLFYTESISKNNLKLLNRVLNFYQFKQISTNYRHDFDVLIVQDFSAIDAILSTLKDNQFCFILNIRKHKESYRKWLQTIAKESITVSIDLFDIGIIINRAAQQKEYFKLKAKY